MSETNGADFLAGFVLGALAGTSLALLVAPHPGEQTRQQIKEQSIELTGRARELPGRARKQAQGLAARGRMALNERMASVEEAVAEGKKAGNDEVQELRAKLDAARSG